MRTRSYTGIFKLVIMSSLTDSQLYIKQVLWLIESRYCQNNQLFAWTTRIVKVTMLILMVIKWICMHFRPIWQRHKLSFVLVINYMKILQTENLSDKLCKTLLYLQSISLWGIYSSKNQISVSYCISLLFLCLTKGQRTVEFSW